MCNLYPKYGIIDTDTVNREDGYETARERRT